ncbi:CTLH/CRA C-terminal to lish motif domain-containing protein [Geranomyces variabilis]|nr:CTLH/CRA C-terminal to lish motif domain-containing protein [Geranomyces variabilis]KAJ3139936.1 hypothetical protein HDU90_008837 [Geranomyces variabilis]
MDALESISNDFAKVSAKQASSAAELASTLEKLIAIMTTAREEIARQPSSLASSLALLKQATTSSAKHLTSQQEDFRRAALKHEKTLRAAFKTDLDNIWDPRAFDGHEHTLDRAIGAHFVREGQFAIAETFAREGELDPDEGLPGQFADLYTILEALRRGDLSGAIAWASHHKEELDRRASGLEFALHRLQFVQLLSGGEREAALHYAKSSFGPFSLSHLKEIQRLMCSCLYASRLHTSPYADLLHPSAQLDVQKLFTREFCQLLGLPPSSPLFTSALVGTLALPTIVKMSSIMKDRSGLEWSQAGELPVEIPLANEQRYHSVFACPVSKEQSTDENPPMLMACGHVLCKFCIDRLSKGNSNLRFKCPYCPTESTASQSKRIYI